MRVEIPVAEKHFFIKNRHYHKLIIKMEKKEKKQKDKTRYGIKYWDILNHGY